MKRLSLNTRAMQIYVLILSWICLYVALIFSLFILSFNSIYSTGINGGNYDIKTWPLADLSGYFVIGYDSSTNIAKICKYTFSSSSAQCQTITNIKLDSGTWWYQIASSSFSGATSTSLYNLQMYKITFSLTSVNWANQIACNFRDMICILFRICAELWRIYSLLVLHIRIINNYIFILLWSVCVWRKRCRTTRYKSSTAVSICMGVSFERRLRSSNYSSPSSLVMYSISSSAFTIKSFSGTYLYGWGVEPSSGR